MTDQNILTGLKNPIFSNATLNALGISGAIYTAASDADSAINNAASGLSTLQLDIQNAIQAPIDLSQSMIYSTTDDVYKKTSQVVTGAVSAEQAVAKNIYLGLLSGENAIVSTVTKPVTDAVQAVRTGYDTVKTDVANAATTANKTVTDAEKTVSDITGKLVIGGVVVAAIILIAVLVKKK